TGGTAKATVDLIEKTQAIVAGLIFLMELDRLGGREVLAGNNVSALIKF
ncbi:adenine phosphoribosyltransferase, partial [Francisella tularensis subsp. holarctica]|nr:adenine phosphoribosyltransferase [Francisella tularensis subsp. holarctica]